MQHAQRLATPGIGAIRSLAPTLPALFVTSVLSGAFLLFAVEPMFTKMLLPLFGGSPAVWNTAIIFYQVALLAGYGYAHVLRTRLSPLTQVIMHGTLAVVVLLALPIRIPPIDGDPTSTPILSLLWLAAVGVGLPFFVLSANSSLMQSWYARSTGGNTNPYALFAASNFGSMAALLAYPFLIEPNFGLKAQSALWAFGYSVFALQMLGCAALMLRASRHQVVAIGPNAAIAAPVAISKKQIARWLVLAALPSSLMLGVTSYFEDQVAAIPLFWTVPLALYLLTFVIAFGFGNFVSRERIGRVVPYVILVLVALMVISPQMAIEAELAIHLGAFFVIALYCHATLYAERPPEARLTEFYLWLALGGALGGIFNALIAPVLFARVLEYPIALAAGALLLPARSSSASKMQKASDFVYPALLAIAIVSIAVIPVLFNHWIAEDAATFIAAAVVAASFIGRPTRFALGVAAILVIAMWLPTWLGSEMLVTRNFFGVKHVSRSPEFHSLVHGATLHGIESTIYGQERTPLSYYSKQGPLGDIFRNLGPQLARADIAVAGLGVGTTACYATAGQNWTFYEIDPQVVAIATNPTYFRYLSTCTPHAKIVLGDARLSLVAAPQHHDALLVLDAYTSDQPPVHLITKEAFDAYLSALTPHGAIAIDISNRHFDLAPVLGNIAEAEGMVAYGRADDSPRREIGTSSSNWVILARSNQDLHGLADDPRWHPIGVSPTLRLWTDDFSSLTQVWTKH